MNQGRVPLSRALRRLASGDFGVRPGGRVDAAVAGAFDTIARRLACADAAASASGSRPRRPWPPPGDRNGRVYVASVGVDRLAALRAQLGPQIADGILRELAGRVAQALPGAEIGRLGRATVEFSFEAPDEEAAHAILLTVHHRLEQPVSGVGGAFDLSVAIGYADAGVDPEAGDAALEHAEQALSLARAGHVKCMLFGEKDRADASERMALMRDLRGALAREELFLVYQPKLHARSGRIDSVEALVRWRHPRHGLVPPDRFIGLAESTGDIRALTRQVLARSVDDQAILRAGGHDLEVHVNLSGGLVADEGFCGDVLAEWRRSEGRIGLEITETAVIADPERALRNLRAFAEAGVSIAIDDYGSGLSSLAYLKELPARELKIDRMFVSGLISSHRDPLLVRSTIDLAHALEMEVTAEGVDHPTALALLRVMGCDRMQGYQIAPPMPLDELGAFLTTSATAAGVGAPSPALDRLDRAAGR